MRSVLPRPVDEVVGDVLATARHGQVSVLRTERSEPWSTRFPSGSLIAFHVAAAGGCVVHAGDAAPFALAEGELVVFSRGDAHVLASPPAPHGAIGMLCGGFPLARDAAHPIFGLLPSVLRMRWRGGPLPELGTVVDLMLREVRVGAPYTGAVLTRLAEVMLLYVVRAWVLAQPSADAGWVSALRDPRIGRALARIHESASRAWTLDALASSAAMSRSAFARRFVALVGATPLSYVAARRIDHAAQLLRDGDESVAHIAHAVGYGSEFAFSRAFRRARGLAPRDYRAARGQRDAP